MPLLPLTPRLLVAGALALPFVLLAGPARAQTPVAASAVAAPAPPVRKGGNVLKLAPLGWIHGQLPFTVEWRLGYERRLGKRNSLAASYSHLGSNVPFSFLGSFALSAAISSAVTLSGHPSIGWTSADIRARGSRWQVQYRQYLTDRRLAPEGWYVSPQFSYAAADYTIRLKDWGTAMHIELKNHNYNLLFGHQRVWGKHFVFDVFTGLGYRQKSTFIVNAAGENLEQMPNATHLKLSSGLNLGWAF